MKKATIKMFHATMKMLLCLVFMIGCGKNWADISLPTTFVADIRKKLVDTISEPKELSNAEANELCSHLQGPVQTSFTNGNKNPKVWAYVSDADGLKYLIFESLSLDRKYYSIISFDSTGRLYSSGRGRFNNAEEYEKRLKWLENN